MRKWLLLSGLCCCVNLFAVDSDGDGLSDAAEKLLGTPADTAAVFHQVHQFKLKEKPASCPEKLKKISVAHIAEDRFLWKAEFDSVPDVKNMVLHFYIDADNDRATGRKNVKGPVEGTDYMCSVAYGNPNIVHYGETAEALTGIRWCGDGKNIYLAADTPLNIRNNIAEASVFIMCHNKPDEKSANSVRQVTSGRKIKFSVPLNPGKKILRILDHKSPWNMKRTYGIKMIKKLVYDTQGVVHVPFDKLQLDGYEVNLFTQRHFGNVIAKNTDASVYTKAPAGTYYPAVLVYDSGMEKSCLEMTIDGVSRGVATLNIGNKRYWIYYLDKKITFRGGEEVRIFARSAGKCAIYSILFLPFEPSVNALPYKISNLVAFTQQQQAGSAGISWLTEMPSVSRFEYGLNGRFDMVAEKRNIKTLVHGVELKGLKTDAVYTGRAVAFRPDGTKYVSKPITFKAVPVVKKSGSVKRASIPLKVTVGEKEKFAPGLVTTGIPFPKGTLSTAPAVRLSRKGRSVPVQYKVTGWWDDGSAKWVLVSFVTTPGIAGDLIYDLEYGNDLPAPKAEKAIAEMGKDGVYVNGVRRVDKNGDLLVQDMAVNTEIKLAAYADAKWDEKADVSIEYNGHVRAVVKSVRKLKAPDGTALVSLEQRFTFAANTPAVEIAHTFTILHGKPFLDFTSISLNVPGVTDASFPVPYYQRNESEVLCGKNVITTQLDGTFIGKNIAVSVRDFWQNYPKGFASDGKKLTIRLCPELTDDYYDKFPFEKEGHHLFYYLRNRVYRLKRDSAKTHHITVVSNAGYDVMRSAAEQGRYRLLGIAPAKWYCESGAFYDVMPQDYEKFASYEKAADSNMATYRKMQRAVRDYGMMNFGDWYPERGANWGNSEYDTQLAFFLQFIRSGDRNAFFLGEEMELHNRDIDTPASSGGVLEHQMGHVGDYYKKSVPGTLGIPRLGASVSHAWAEGDFIHYFLTGDVRSYEYACRKVSYFIDTNFRSPYDFHSLRVPGWHLIMNSYALASTNDPLYLNASRLIVERVLELQDDFEIPLAAHQQSPGRKGHTGGWMRMMVPGHCWCIPRCRGNANFMVAVALSGLKYYHDVTGDPRVKKSIIDGALYLAESCYSEQHGYFRYTPCMKMRYTFGVSPLMTEGIARAYLWTKDARLRHALQTMIDHPRKEGAYGKPFSMYYRNAPRVMADIAKSDVKCNEEVK